MNCDKCGKKLCTEEKEALPNLCLDCTNKEKRKFIRDYAVNFCASYIASKYDEFCNSKWTDEKCRPPMEDAIHLAGYAWDEYQKALKEGD